MGSVIIFKIKYFVSFTHIEAFLRSLDSGVSSKIWIKNEVLQIDSFEEENTVFAVLCNCLEKFRFHEINSPSLSRAIVHLSSRDRFMLVKTFLS